MLHALDFVTSTFDGNIPALLYMCYTERCGEENLRHHSVLTEVFTLLSLASLLHIQTAISPYGPPMWCSVVFQFVPLLFFGSNLTSDLLFYFSPLYASFQSLRGSPRDVVKTGPLHTLLLKFLPTDSNHFFIGTNMVSLIHVISNESSQILKKIILL